MPFVEPELKVKFSAKWWALPSLKFIKPSPRIGQAFRFKNWWRVKKSSPQSGEASDHSPELNAMANWLMKIKKNLYNFQFEKNWQQWGELYFAHSRQIWRPDRARFTAYKIVEHFFGLSSDIVYLNISGNNQVNIASFELAACISFSVQGRSQGYEHVYAQC